MIIEPDALLKREKQEWPFAEVSESVLELVDSWGLCLPSAVSAWPGAARGDGLRLRARCIGEYSSYDFRCADTSECTDFLQHGHTVGTPYAHLGHVVLRLESWS